MDTENQRGEFYTSLNTAEREVKTCENPLRDRRMLTNKVACELRILAPSNL